MSDTRVTPTSDDARQCPQCGTPLPAGALAGLCPACLLKQGAAEDTNTAGAQSFDPPTANELAPLFPQLEILELIGKGGMGAVYKARQKQLDRIVALKILPPGIGSDPAFAERFTREARALAKLNHPNIVTLYEFGSSGRESAQTRNADVEANQRQLTSATTGRLYYFLMEFVDGVTLRQLLNSSRVSSREALAIVPQICDALQFAHDQGIVHRDIKPENILLDRRGRVKVADFGLAKIVVGNESLTPSLSPSDGERVAKPGEGSPVLTDAGKIMGTLKYMAPEQIEHPAEVDHRADIYALGVVFYQMLTGELPGKKIEPPSKKVSIDVRLDEVVLRALEKQPDLRYQQASVLKTQVETIAETPLVGSSEPRPSSLGREYRTRQTILGLPWVHVAWGIDPETNQPRVAKGIVAIGPTAYGIVAVGLNAFGVLSTGIVAAGAFPVGLLAVGFSAVGLAAAGAQAVGLFALASHKAVGLLAASPKPIGLREIVIGWDKVLAAVILFGFFCLAVRKRMLQILRRAMGSDTSDRNLAPLAEAWLALADGGEYARSWETAAPYFQRKLSKDEWVARLEKVRRPLGNILHRKLITVTPHAAGTQRVVTYASAFETLPSATEAVTFMKQANGQWQAVGYLIRPGSAALDIFWLPTTSFSKPIGWIWMAIFACYFFLLLNDHYSGPLDRSAWTYFSWAFLSFAVLSSVELLVRIRRARNADAPGGTRAVKSLWRPMIAGGAIALLISGVFVAWPAYQKVHSIEQQAKSDYIGQTWFPEGDSIELTSVSRTKSAMTVKGRYDLVSHEEALLALHITSTNASGFPPSAATQSMKISKGRGEFELTDPQIIPGLPHVSMYASNYPFASLYFGTKAEAEEERRADWITNRNQHAISAKAPDYKQAVATLGALSGFGDNWEAAMKKGDQAAALKAAAPFLEQLRSLNSNLHGTDMELPTNMVFLLTKACEALKSGDMASARAFHAAGMAAGDAFEQTVPGGSYGDRLLELAGMKSGTGNSPMPSRVTTVAVEQNVTYRPDSESDEESTNHANASPFSFRWVVTPGATNAASEVLSDDRQQKFHVLAGPILTDRDVEAAGWSLYDKANKSLEIFLTKQGATKFAQVTAQNVGRQLAVVWNGRVLSAPVIQGPIPSGHVRVTGQFSDAEAQQLLDVLNHRRPNSGAITNGAAATNPALTALVNCMKKIRETLLAARMYADAHDQNWPSKLSDLGQFLEPSFVQSISESLEYFRPKLAVGVTNSGSAAWANTPVLFESKPTDPTGECVGFADGHVEFVKQSDRLRDLRAAAKQ